MISVYQNGGCGKTLTKINDTMPHTCNMPIDWCGYTNSIYTRNECCSLSLSQLKTTTFPFQDCENTFYMSVIK